MKPLNTTHEDLHQEIYNIITSKRVYPSEALEIRDVICDLFYSILEGLVMDKKTEDIKGLLGTTHRDGVLNEGWNQAVAEQNTKIAHIKEQLRTSHNEPLHFNIGNELPIEERTRLDENLYQELPDTIKSLQKEYAQKVQNSTQDKPYNKENVFATRTDAGDKKGEPIETNT